MSKNKEIRCAVCQTLKVFWDVIVQRIRSDVPDHFYTCGCCYKRLENNIFKHWPDASIRREKIGLVDLVAFTKGRDLANQQTKLWKKIARSKSNTGVIIK